MSNLLTFLSLISIPLFLWLIDVYVSLSSRRKSYEFSGNRHADFTVLVPIYGHVRYLENAEYLSQYGGNVLLCTTGGETAEFNRGLKKIAKKYGFNIFFASWSSAQNPSSRATSGTIRDRLIRDALDNVTTEFVVPLDADSVSIEPIAVAVGELQALDGDIASVKLVPTNGDQNGLTRLQKFEYRIAMDMRFVVPWLVSGACQIAKTSVLKDIMNRHSLFFQGNDVEIGLIAKKRGYKVVHIPFEVHTALPSTFKAWYRQRLAWGGGEFRLFIINFRIILQHPFFWIYGAFIVILALPLRYISVMQFNLSLAVILALYVSLVTALHWKHKNVWLAMMPIYTIVLSLVLVPLGAVWYFYMAIKDKNMGIIKPNRKSRVA